MQTIDPNVLLQHALAIVIEENVNDSPIQLSVLTKKSPSAEGLNDSGIANVIDTLASLALPGTTKSSKGVLSPADPVKPKISAVAQDDETTAPNVHFCPGAHLGLANTDAKLDRVHTMSDWPP